ncbi:MAG: large conductance mechanosensitive channel protein MscL [Chloroflexi bacterium]|nr:large conductance mechanosensitive channel protein MscL [Chloroflexota bacterium]
MLKEFGDFVKRGNVMDLAVAVILGGAFGAIVKSLVDDILMPILSLFTGGIDFSNLFIALDDGNYATLAAAQEAGAATLNYGLFINAVINFLVIAFTIFMIVRQINKMQKPAPAVPAAPPEPSAEEKLLTEIRDLLAKK